MRNGRTIERNYTTVEPFAHDSNCYLWAKNKACGAERGTWLAGLGDAKGVVTTVKVTLIGRPGKVVERSDFTLLLLQHSGPLPVLPKGIPLPLKLLTTTSIVYLAAKHWRTVAEALKAPEDALIVEGVQFYDAEYVAITVLATNATTKLLQQAKRPDGAVS